MNQKLLYIILSIFLMWLPSCVMENAYCPDFVGGEDNPFTISFVLSTRDVMTRAESDTTWGDNYDKVIGNDFENQIKSLSLIIYNSTGDKVATITDFNYFATAGAASDGCVESYLITTEIKQQIGLANEKYRFVIVANADLGADVENTIYELGDIVDEGIPMWGVTTQTVQANSNVNLGTIHLLRAVAKIEVKLSDNVATSFNIENAVVTKYNSKGYVFPFEKDCESTLILDHAENTFNALYDVSSLSGNLIFTIAEDKKTCYVYITEWEAIAENAKIVLQLKDTKTIHAFEIEFKNYQDGKSIGEPHDVVRNHYYKYTVTQVSTTQEITIECAVLPWVVVYNNLEVII